MVSSVTASSRVVANPDPPGNETRRAACETDRAEDAVEWPWVSSRRRRSREEGLPDEIVARLPALVPALLDLDDAERDVHAGLVALFLEEKSFEGCGGLELTDDIRLTIAATACLLLVGLEVGEPFPGLDAIRVYPSAVRIPRADRVGHVVVDGPVAHLGLSSRHGFVVLSWDAARAGAADPKDGHNVVLHEFAHQLDTQDGAADGAPYLPRDLYGPWAEVLGAAYERLSADVSAARRPAIDPYGATSPAEFFAVATEAFFERPRQLRRDEPALFEVLWSYYKPGKPLPTETRGQG
jgi:MtfA peptidase